MKPLHAILCAILFSSFVPQVYCQTIQGRVTDTGGEPVVGAVLVEKAVPGNGVMTGEQGNFQIDIHSEGAILEVSCIGYISESVPAVQGMTVCLKEDTDVLDEVVVIGYGSQKREYLTGSVAQTSSEEILKAPVTNSQQLLTGRLAGLTNIQTTGTPGADDTQMYIRGLSSFNGNTPICVVDGVKHDIGIIKTLNPNDIETVSVLKDAASTSVYGLDGSNGVIVITTKTGTSSKSKVSYDGSVSFDFNTAMIELMDAQEYIYWNNKAREMDGLPLYWTEENVQKLKDMGLYGETDWLKEIYKPFGLTHQHNISATGGNSSMRYYASLGYMGQEGILRNTDYERYNFRTNLDTKVAGGVSFKSTFSVQWSNRHLPAIPLDAQSEYSPITQALYACPILKTEYEGLPLGITNGTYTYTPVAGLYNGGYQDQRYGLLSGTLTLEYDFGTLWDVLEGLKLSVFGGFTGDLTINHQYVKPFRQAQFNPKTFTVSVVNFIPYTKTTFIKSHSYASDVTLRPGLTYERTFGKHSVSFMGLFEGEKSYVSYLSGTGYGFASDDPIDLNMATESVRGAASGSHTHSAFASFVYRIGYNYDGKYILETSGRFNGSYVFAPASRWGFFPSLAASWVLSKEPFIKDNIHWIDHLKLRLSAGQTGMSDISPYSYMLKFRSTGASDAYGIGLEPVKGYYTTGYPFTDATWSRMYDWNAGLDAMLFGKKLTAGVDVFYQYRDHILEAMTSSAYSPSLGGNHPVYENSGRMDNRGFELTLRHDNWFSNGLTYSLEGMLMFARNRVLSKKISDDHPSYRAVLGEPLGVVYGFKCIGLFQTEEELLDAPTQPQGTIDLGEQRYLDVNGDGKITSQYDYVRLGYSEVPEMTFSLNANVGWKNWSLSALFQGATLVTTKLCGVYNNSVTDNTVYTRTFYGLDATNGNIYVAENSWTPEHTDARYPRIHQGWNGNTMWISDMWLVDGSYLRLKNLQLTYTLPDSVARKISMSRVDAYLAGTNIFTLSYYKWMDPENPGVNDGFYPQQRTYSVGLNLTF